jgi:predicted amidophosphoribosyltransferase
MALAQLMSKQHSKTIIQGKFQLSFKKQTSKKRVSRHEEVIRLTLEEGERKTLIVDDVLSSGQTLCTLSKNLPGHKLRYFCLMRSRAINVQKNLIDTSPNSVKI